MKIRSTRTHRLVLVTAPGVEVARKLAVAVLESRLAACVSLVPKVESHYWWQGRIETAAEVLLVMKTTVRKVRRLAEVVRANHPYDTPEFVTLPLNAGSDRYLSWVTESASGA